VNIVVSEIASYDVQARGGFEGGAVGTFETSVNVVQETLHYQMRLIAEKVLSTLLISTALI
jgi:hypothetical protein